MTATTVDIVLYSTFAFLGNCGVALTGFGMAIIYLFWWQIATIAGFQSNFKYAVFLQALALFSAQPLLVYKTKLWKYASKKMLLYFIPVTIVSTPIGQYVSSLISTTIVEMVGGILVCFVAAFELYQKRVRFWKWFLAFARWVTCYDRCCLRDDNAEEAEDFEAIQKKDITSKSLSHSGGKNVKSEEAEDSGAIQKKDDEECPSPTKVHRKLPEKDQKVEEDHNRFKLSGVEDNLADDKEAMSDQSNDENNPSESTIPDPEQALDNSNSNDGLASNEPFHFSTVAWTIVAGFASGFLGGLCAIRGPPIILYMLHPPHPVCFSNKKTQRATGAAITLTNVTMRVIYYLVNTLAFDQTSSFVQSDWPLYLSTVVLSCLGVLAGTALFNVLKDKKDALNGVLTILLVLCGISLVLSAFSVIER